MTVDEIRRSFPHTRQSVYMNHAAVAPLSTPVMEAVRHYLDERHGVDIENFEAFEPILHSARERVAALIGAEVSRVDFAANTSYALNILTRGLDWRQGDRVAVPACEFPANVYPFLHVPGVEVDFIPHEDGVVSLDAVERALGRRTRVLTLSWVQYLSGFRADLSAVGRLCRDRDIIFCVDAIQGAGAFELDVVEAGIDFLACGGHKWLMATQGIGFLYVTEALQDRIAPGAGWLHGPVDWDHLDTYHLTFHDDATRYRLGTLNHVGIAALDAALGLRETAGPAWCERQVLERVRRLARGLDRLGLRRYGSPDPRHASGIVTIDHPEAAALEAHLRRDAIATAVRQGKLRFSPAYYTSMDEVDRTLASVEAYLTRRT